jgi:hypothetical protein
VHAKYVPVFAFGLSLDLEHRHAAPQLTELGQSILVKAIIGEVVLRGLMYTTEESLREDEESGRIQVREMRNRCM